ncbi:PEGA domain-containing protein [Myxococcota bacterium]
MAAPLPVLVVTQGDTAPLVQVANQLRQSLARDARVTITGQVGVPGPDLSQNAQAIARARELIDGAKLDYSNLDPQAALSKLGQVENGLRPRLNQEEAPQLLARALRLKGLTLMFTEKAEDATTSFASSIFLDPGFSPAAAEWPPEARLAFADAGAAVSRSSAGALSVRVQPEVARVWVDGREEGVGSTTVRGLPPGDHFILVRCPGFSTFSGVVKLEGEGKLANTSVFLEPLSDDGPRQWAVNELAEAFGGRHELVVTRQVVGLLGVSSIIMVVADPLLGNGTTPAAWVLGADGERQGGSIPVTSSDQTASQLVSRLTGTAEIEVEEPVGPPGPWYMQWYTWVGTGLVVIGGGVALIFALDQESDRVSFHTGSTP